MLISSIAGPALTASNCCKYLVWVKVLSPRPQGSGVPTRCFINALTLLQWESVASLHGNHFAAICRDDLRVSMSALFHWARHWYVCRKIY